MTAILRTKGLEEKAALLGRAARDEVCADGRSENLPFDPAPGRLPGWLKDSVYTSLLPGGRRIKLLKILLDNRCRLGCRYCGLRARSETERCRLEPEVLARLFLSLHRRGTVEGLFLSSALPDDPDRVQERLVKTAELLRRTHRWPGYLHLKIMPGAGTEAVAASCRWADRVSVNLESPSAGRLRLIAPGKNFREAVMATLRRAAEEAGKRGRVRAGVTTQLVVGAAGESDREILTATDSLYRKLGLRRAYYSPFRAETGTPLQDLPSPPPERSIRLYQADWLLREYGFDLDELPFGEDGELPAGRDPKLAWARSRPESFPVEINRASLPELLRVPGIGRRGAAKILAARREKKLTAAGDLRRLRLPVARMTDFITLDGRRPGPASPGDDRQLLLEL